MTDRDHFAAAALTGLLASGMDSVDEMPTRAYRMADAMLRERGSHIPDAGKMVEKPKETQDGPASTPQVPRKPRTPQADRLTEWERHGSHRWGLGVASDLYDLECRVAVMEKGLAATPVTCQERFNAAVMNWISEATVIYGHNEIMADACEKCWAAYGKDSTNDDAEVCERERCLAGVDCPGSDNAAIHDAAPAARASVESVVPQPTTRGDSDRTDKAAPRPSEGTGDTPATHATPAQGSVQRECTEPVAWALMRHGKAEQVAVHPVYLSGDIHRVAPLYAYQPPMLTAAERDAIQTAMNAYGSDNANPECAAIEATLWGLLERTK